MEATSVTRRWLPIRGSIRFAAMPSSNGSYTDPRRCIRRRSRCSGLRVVLPAWSGVDAAHLLRIRLGVHPPSRWSAPEAAERIVSELGKEGQILRYPRVVKPGEDQNR